MGKTLATLSKLVRPKKVLEIGTLGGYSTLWLAQGLADGGEILTIECEEEHAKIAKQNFYLSHYAGQIHIKQGLAADILVKLLHEGAGPFDLIFIDADKENYPNYLEPCVELSRPGTLILSDNLIPKRGEIGNPDPSDNEAIGIYTFNQKVATHPKLDSILLSTLVGEEGRTDALGVSIVIHNQDAFSAE